MWGIGQQRKQSRPSKNRKAQAKVVIEHPK